MEHCPYQIAIDRMRNLLSITFASVLWSADVAGRFREECRVAIAALPCQPGGHVVLVDLRNAVLQPKDVIEKMQAFAASSTSRRIALVASSPLARMQTKRLQVREGIMLFAELADAEEWLFA